MKKLISMMLAVVLILGCVSITASASGTQFTDVPSNAYYYNAVSWAVKNGITKGTAYDKFSPNDGCTRGQVVTFLWRAHGCPEPARTNVRFADVKSSEYYASAVAWAVENGITKGTGANTFSPDDTCTRAQIVTFLWRALGNPKPDSVHTGFNDVKSNEYYTSAVAWAVENSITNGTSSTKFSPEDSCTRGQIVTFLYRAMAESDTTTEHEHKWVWNKYSCKEGYSTYLCTVCGETKTEGTGIGKDCTWEAIKVVPPTTEEMGYTVYKCSDCRDTWTDYDKEKLPAEKEPEPSDNPNRGPFYDDDGNIIRCLDYNGSSECSFVTKHSGSQLLVDYSMGTYYAPTCEKWGYSYFKCTICGFDYKYTGWGKFGPEGESLTPLGHAYQKTSDASPFDPHSCGRCGDVRTVDPSLASASDEALDSIQKRRVEAGLPELIVDNTWLSCAKATAAYRAQIDYYRGEEVLSYYGFDGGFTYSGLQRSAPDSEVFLDPQYTKICIAECDSELSASDGSFEFVYLLFD